MTLSRSCALVLLLFVSTGCLSAGEWQNLVTPSLEHWERVGDGVWEVVEGAILGYRIPEYKAMLARGPVDDKEFHRWLYNQSWLYTKKDYDEYDLHVEYWIKQPGNSGISIRDTSRARYCINYPEQNKTTPAHICYEIQLISKYRDPARTGSLYTFTKAPDGHQVDGEWNVMNVEVRRDIIRVRVNGAVVTEHAGDSKRPKVGPVGLQLHDQFSFVMFRNIRIREIGR
jgi:hypothetical protein